MLVDTGDFDGDTLTVIFACFLCWQCTDQYFWIWFSVLVGFTFLIPYICILLLRLLVYFPLLFGNHFCGLYHILLCLHCIYKFSTNFVTWSIKMLLFNLKINLIVCNKKLHWQSLLCHLPTVILEQYMILYIYFNYCVVLRE